MASKSTVAAVANRTLVIGIVNDNTSNSHFSTFTQDAAHINWCNTVCCRIMACCLNIAYIVGGSNTAIVGKAANAADVGITRNITCIIAAGNCRAGITAFTGIISSFTLNDFQSLIISQTVPIAIRFLRHVNFTDDAANIDSM